MRELSRRGATGEHARLHDGCMKTMRGRMCVVAAGWPVGDSVLKKQPDG